MLQRKEPFRVIRISESILKLFEDRKKKEGIPGPFNPYVEMEIARMVHNSLIPTEKISSEITQLKRLVVETAIENNKEIVKLKEEITKLLKGAPVEVKAFRPPQDKSWQTKNQRIA